MEFARRKRPDVRTRIKWQGDRGASKSPGITGTRREAAAVCPRRRERTGRRAERGSPTGHDIGQPSAVSTGAVPPRNAARGRGLAATINGSTPAATPPKYRDALERSGNPKDTREILVEGRVLGRACDWRRVPFENLSGRPAGSRHTRSFWGRAISPLCRKSLSSSRLPFSVAPAVLHFRGMVMRNKAGVRAVAPAMVTDTRT